MDARCAEFAGAAVDHGFDDPFFADETLGLKFIKNALQLPRLYFAAGQVGEQFGTRMLALGEQAKRLALEREGAARAGRLCRLGPCLRHLLRLAPKDHAQLPRSAPEQARTAKADVTQNPE
jgi:hypothetical protein